MICGSATITIGLLAAAAMCNGLTIVLLGIARRQSRIARAQYVEITDVLGELALKPGEDRSDYVIRLLEMAKRKGPKE